VLASRRGILLHMTTTPHPLALPDGRTLEVLVTGPEGAPLVVNLHGTPSGHDLAPELEQAAARAGLRVASIARPGYAGSTRLPGRAVADVVPDVLAVVDALGADRFAVMGTSGGGPHALAVGALAADRCAAVASVSGVGPWAAEGLDFLDGMGEGNEIEFGAALEGEVPLRELLLPWREEMVSAGPDGTFAAMQSVLSPPDQKVFTGEVAAHLHASVSLALRDGVDGWIDDDLAFTRPWGFTPADVSVPVFLWQGEQDLMVPPAHGRWLATRLPDCRARLLPDDGHLTLLVNRPGEVLADLAQALGHSA
jgi:pimeloyl-ACP methyl ester carboxylesterase